MVSSVPIILLLACSAIFCEAGNLRKNFKPAQEENSDDLTAASANDDVAAPEASASEYGGGGYGGGGYVLKDFNDFF